MNQPPSSLLYSTCFAWGRKKDQIGSDEGVERTVDGGCAKATVRHGYVRSTLIRILVGKVLGRSNAE